MPRLIVSEHCEDLKQLLKIMDQILLSTLLYIIYCVIEVLEFFDYIHRFPNPSKERGMEESQAVNARTIGFQCLGCAALEKKYGEFQRNATAVTFVEFLWLNAQVRMRVGKK